MNDAPARQAGRSEWRAGSGPSQALPSFTWTGGGASAYSPAVLLVDVIPQCKFFGRGRAEPGQPSPQGCLIEMFSPPPPAE